jgi:benzylsuccinate CoA-transferase BbsF subunit
MVILHMPAFGRTGDYAESRGYGAHIDSVAGSSTLRGYRDSAPLTNMQIFAGDFFAGMHGAIAVLAALRHRRRTGEGQVIELAQVECSAQMFPQAALDAAWNGREHGTIGNRSIEGFVPNGVFPTSGVDQWIAISCRSDAEWAALVSFMGSPEWASDESLATAERRADRQDMIEERLADWTSPRNRDELFHALQAAGITAGPVLNAREAAEDAHLEQSGTWQEVPATADYPATKFNVPPYHFSKSNVGIRSSPALFGEHNEYVYREVLGVSDDEYGRLLGEGHIRDTYDADVIERG